MSTTPSNESGTPFRVVGATEALTHRSAPVQRLLELAKTWPAELQHNIPPAASRCRTTRQLSSDEINAVVEAHRSGLTVGQTAVLFDLHRSTIGRHLAVHGINTRSPLLTPEEIEEASQLYRSGQRLQDLAQRYDVGVTTINRILKDHEVEMRPKGRRRTRCR